MGFRTVVVLNNDLADKWESDPQLGRQIWMASCAIGRSDLSHEFKYGQIVEQVHADLQTLAVLDGYSGNAVAHTHWNRGQTDEVRNLALLKEFADKMGYRISKKPTRIGTPD